MKRIVVKDKMQSNYIYFLTEEIGDNFSPEFQPQLTPKQMLAMGIFGGKYMTDCTDEFPNDWFENAKLSPQGKDIKLNFFGVDASMPLSHWNNKGWIYKDDPRGWFQWYCRYFLGRRIEEEDTRQIKRWRAIKRHLGAIKKNCNQGDYTCRIKQRQALLHWAYDTRLV